MKQENDLGNNFKDTNKRIKNKKESNERRKMIHTLEKDSQCYEKNKDSTFEMLFLSSVDYCALVTGNNPCQWFCATDWSTGNAVCSCPDGYRLNGNGVTCSGMVFSFKNKKMFHLDTLDTDNDKKIKSRQTDGN